MKMCPLYEGVLNAGTSITFICNWDFLSVCYCRCPHLGYLLRRVRLNSDGVLGLCHVSSRKRRYDIISPIKSQWLLASTLILITLYYSTRLSVILQSAWLSHVQDVQSQQDPKPFNGHQLICQELSDRNKTSSHPQAHNMLIFVCIKLIEGIYTLLPLHYESGSTPNDLSDLVPANLHLP